MPIEPQKADKLDHNIIDLSARIKDLEKGAAERDMEIALIQKDLEYLKAGQSTITTGINRIFWTVVTVAVGAATTFVISGGLAALP